MVTVCKDDEPVVMFPKFRLLELKESVCVAVDPVPLKATIVGELGALLTSVKLPLTVPAAAGWNCALNVAVAPGFTVKGKATVPTLNPLPAALIWLMVNAVFPELLTISVWLFAEPTGTLPKLTLPGFTDIVDCTPVPLTATTLVAPVELVMVTLPETVSAFVGLNATFIEVLAPAFRTNGVATPEAWTSAALTLTCEIVRLVLPLLVIVTLLVIELPVATLPKLNAVGDADMLTVAATPVPLSATVAGEFTALLAMLTVLFRVPAVVGANTALKVVVAPAATETGVVNPPTL